MMHPLGESARAWDRAREMLAAVGMNIPYRLVDCPACGAREDEEIASRDELVVEMEELWEFHLRRLRPGVPRRFLTDRVVFSQDPPLRIGRCLACGTLFRNPVEEGEELVELYAGEEVGEAVLQGLFEAQRTTYRAQAERLTRIAGSPGTALEVGSHVGGFQAAGTERGWVVEGVDPNAGAVEFARRAGHHVHHGVIANVEDAPQYDAVVIWNCFDQLPDPRPTVAHARDRLRAGGILAIRVPSGEFYARHRRRSGSPGSPLLQATLAMNNLLGFPYRNGFTAESLSGLLHAAGLEAIALVGDTLPPLADRWTRGWARGEERIAKLTMRYLLRGARAPWLEIYARKP